MNRKFADKLNLIRSMHQLLHWKTLILILKLQKRNVFRVFDTVSKPKQFTIAKLFNQLICSAANSPAQTRLGRRFKINARLFRYLAPMKFWGSWTLPNCWLLWTVPYMPEDSLRQRIRCISHPHILLEKKVESSSWDCLSLELNFSLVSNPKVACLPKPA